MTAMLPDQHPGASEVLADKPRAGVNWHLVLAVVLALALGGLAGLFVGRATSSEKTVTKTVQVSAPAYSTSSTVDATVVFDGKVAAYQGPAEVKAGTVVHFRLNAADGLLVVGRIDPGFSWEQVVAYTSTAQPPWLSDITTSAVNVKGVTTTTLSKGVYVVAVLTSPASGSRAYYATMIRVIK